MEAGEEDFLIATDIDKLIDILSTKRDVEVGKLAKELRLNRKEVEKWLLVLEEEGVVDLANRVGSLHALWVMDREVPPSKEAKNSHAPKKEAPAAAKAPQADEGEPPASIAVAEEIGAMHSVSPRPPPPAQKKKKSLFSEIFPRKKSRRKGAKAKSAPRINPGDSGSPREAEPAEKNAGRDYAPALPPKKQEELQVSRESLEREFSESIPDEPQLQLIKARGSPPRSARASAPLPHAPVPEIYPEPRARMKKRLSKTDFLKLPRSQTGKLRSRLEDYLQLIRDSKNELRSLESEKEKMHREGFVALEKDFEANLDSLEYALLEKEKRILEARERVSILPDKIGSLHEIHDSISGFDKDSRKLLSQTKKDLDSSWKRLQQVSRELSDELTKGEDEALYERSRMMQLRDMLASVNHAESELRETLTNSRSMIEEMEEKVRGVEDSLEELADSRTLLNERLEQISSSLEEKMQRLDELREEMGKIDKIEGWFRDYSQDYESKMDELQSYVKESEEELSHIKKAAELEYVKRYLEELDSAEGKYRDNLGALEMEEASVDEKISEVRERINQLMRESSELMSKYRQMTEEGAGFEEMVAAAKSRSREQGGKIAEKARERRKLAPRSPSNQKRPQGRRKSASPPKASSGKSRTRSRKSSRKKKK